MADMDSEIGFGLEERILLLVPYSDGDGCQYRVMGFRPDEVHELLEYTNYIVAPKDALLGDCIKNPY